MCFRRLTNWDIYFHFLHLLQIKYNIRKNIYFSAQLEFILPTMSFKAVAKPSMGSGLEIKYLNEWIRSKPYLFIACFFFPPTLMWIDVISYQKVLRVCTLSWHLTDCPCPGLRLQSHLQNSSGRGKASAGPGWHSSPSDWCSALLADRTGCIVLLWSGYWNLVCTQALGSNILTWWNNCRMNKLMFKADNKTLFCLQKNLQ